jgi:hypothetical protein
MRNLLLVVFALVLVFAMATNGSAQSSISAANAFVATVQSTLALSGGDGAIGPLSGGFTYTLDADINAAQHVTPLVNGSEDGTPLQMVITSDAGTAVEVTYGLPTVLIGASGALRCSFASNSAMCEETASRYNPNAPFVITVGSGNTATLDLGMTVVVPPGALAEDYTGMVTCTVALTGL